MTTSPVQMRNNSRPAAEGSYFEFWLLVITLIVDLALCVAIFHVFHTPGYRRVGRLRDLLVAALALNVLASGLTVLFRLRFSWQHRLQAVLAVQCVICLLPFALVRALRVPAPDVRLHVLGLVYALFVYLHLGTLLIYGVSNEERVREQGSSGIALHIWVFAVSLLIYGAITPWVHVACLPTADEPHYLLLTHSLVFDRDFDLANNYANGNYKNFYPPDIPRQDHHTVTNARGQEVPVHDVGLSVLLVPGYALAGRVGAMFELNGFGALLALGIFELGKKMGASPRAALAAWALFAFTSPVVVYTSQIYPEIVGAAVTVWALVAFASFVESGKEQYLLATAAAVAFLPWLSIRYWLIVGPILAVVALLTVAGDFRRAVVVRRLGLTVLPLLVSLGVFAAFDLYWYQTAIPNAGYVLLLRHRPSLLTPNPLPGLPGLLFDRAFGLLTTAPVYLLAMAGAWVLCRRKPWQGALVVLPVVAYILLAALNKFWYGGWAPPPRYIVTGVAILAPLAAVVFSRRTPRFLVALLAVWSFFIAIAYAAFPLTRYTYWRVNSGALSDFLGATIGFRFGAVFPSFIRAGNRDYLVCLFWLALALAGLCLLVWRANADQKGNSSRPQELNQPRGAMLP